MILCIISSSENASALCLIYFAIIISTVNISPALSSFAATLSVTWLPSHSTALGTVSHFWLTSCSPVLSEVFTGFVALLLAVLQACEAAAVLQPGRSFGHYDKNCPFTALQCSPVPWLVLYLSLEITLNFFSIRKPEVISDNIN